MLLRTRSKLQKKANSKVDWQLKKHNADRCDLIFVNDVCPIVGVLSLLTALRHGGSLTEKRSALR
jgi:hypothetical protein